MIDSQLMTRLDSLRQGADACMQVLPRMMLSRRAGRALWNAIRRWQMLLQMRGCSVLQPRLPKGRLEGTQETVLTILVMYEWYRRGLVRRSNPVLCMHTQGPRGIAGMDAMCCNEIRICSIFLYAHIAHH
jgi:hypothetical protein